MRTVAAAFAVVLAACGNGNDDATSAPTTTSTIPFAQQLCAASAPEQTGTLTNPELIELSGLAASRTFDPVLWAHNDSGDTARLYAIDRSGASIATVALTGVEARDWEDIAAGAGALYVGDIGDNQAKRDGIVVYRVPEPDPAAAAEADAVPIELTYPDGAHDAEALMVDGPTGQLVIVTKELAGNAGVYTAPLDTPGVLARVATLDLGVGQLVTAGDISPAGDAIALRTYGKVFVWERRDGESVAGAFGRAPCEAPAPAEGQGEAIAFIGPGYVTISEGEGAPVWSVSATGRASMPNGGTPGTSSSG